MTATILEEGDLFLMGQGEWGTHDYVSGLYRATGDLDLEVLQAEFLSLGDRFCLRDEDDIAILMGDGSDRLCREVNFQLWLIDQGYVERMPCKLAVLRTEWRKVDHGAEILAIGCIVTDPIGTDPGPPQP